MSIERRPHPDTPEERQLSADELPEPWYRDHGAWYSACPERACDTRLLFGLIRGKLVFAGPTRESAAEQLTEHYVGAHGLRRD